MGYIVAGLCIMLFGVAHQFYRRHQQATPQSVVASLSKGALVFMFSVTILRKLMPVEMGQSATLAPLHVFWQFLAVFVAVSILFGFIDVLLAKRLPRVSKVHNWPVVFKLLIVLLLSLAALLSGFASWFRHFFGNLTPEQFAFNLQSPTVGTASGMSMEIWYTPIFITLTVLLVSGLVIFSKTTWAFLKSIVFKKRMAFIGTVAILSASLYYTYTELGIAQIIKAYTPSTYIADNYVDIRQTNPVFPDKKRNLIHIYFESVESSYTDKANGGYMDEDLMPKLTALAKEGVTFSHTDKLGGPHQTYGSSWSVAAMINMMAGIPLKIDTQGNGYGMDGQFLPGLYNLGDFLHDNGYEQTIMFGADADFGGLTTYFTQHGQFNIFDHKHAKKAGLIPQDYSVWWGFEDDKLYEYAKMELTRLHETGKPFHFSIENADTHFPGGYVTAQTPKKYEQQYANVIAHSAEQMASFVRWIQAQPFYENTTVVITGDHLSMDKDFFKTFDPNYRRSVYNVILNAPITAEKTTFREFSPVDFYPTIVASMGVKFEGNRIGLGTNLFSTEKTLIERDGLQTFNDELGKKSDFYSETLLNKAE